jgi:flavin-dependent dehydrogenase
VELRGGCEASGLLATADRQAVTGVQLVSQADNARSELTADLVVDATGRGNRSTTWLTQLGYRSPREDTLKASVSYASREYQRSRPLPSGMAAAVSSLSPSEPYGMVLIPIEGDRWMLTLIGVGKEVPPVDPAGFDQFARLLPLADLQDVIDHAQPLTEPKRFRIPASVRRRYELLRRLPEGYLVIGDALCAFNPVYAQGMSVAAIEAQVLRDCVRQSRVRLPRRFYRQVARVIDVPWQMAAGGDLAVPTTVGKRTLSYSSSARQWCQQATSRPPQKPTARTRPLILVSSGRASRMPGRFTTQGNSGASEACCPG